VLSLPAGRAAWCGALRIGGEVDCREGSESGGRSRGRIRGGHARPRGALPSSPEAWGRYGAGTPRRVGDGRSRAGPTAAELAGLDVPTGIARLWTTVHPLAVADDGGETSAALRDSHGRVAAFGDDPETIGRAAMLAGCEQFRDR